MKEIQTQNAQGDKQIVTNEWKTFIRKLKECGEQNGFAVEQILG